MHAQQDLILNLGFAVTILMFLWLYQNFEVVVMIERSCLAVIKQTADVSAWG